MITSAALPRALAVMSRNVTAIRHVSYAWVIVSGFFEPVLYLLSIGVGVGDLVGDFTLADGSVVTYAAFVAPAMLAASAMNGAFAETSLNFFAKMQFQKIYDGVLATPVTPMEIALGELFWALCRGSIYSVAFLAVMTAMHLTTPVWALAAFPVTVVVGLGFGALGMGLATLLRSWKDFDYILIGQLALFLFSGTFAPVEGFPPAARIVVEVTPLYHGVALVRGFTTGHPGWALLGHTAYLLALTAAGLWFAGRRMGKRLLK
jgi:lipooligosaccharide transport system permease protein